MLSYLEFYQDLLLVVPEILLLFAALLFQTTSLFIPCLRRVLSYCVVIFLFCLAYLLDYYNLNGEGFNEVYYSSDFTNIIKESILVLTGFIILIYLGYTSNHHPDKSNLCWTNQPSGTSSGFPQVSTFFATHRNELIASSSYITLMLLSVIGMFLIISSRDFILLYMGIELQTLALYIMAAFNTENSKSSEAGLKYFILSALASGIMLFGMSFIYGFSGTLSFKVLHLLYSGHGVILEIPPAVVIGIVMIIVGICFKLSAAPFHMWAPDVYEGSPIISTIFFASVPKLANLAALINILFFAFKAHTKIWLDIIFLVSILSLIVGSFGAIMQSSIKRLMAYSSIVNIGYICIAIASNNFEAVSYSIIYFLIYAISIIGFFATLVGILPEKIDEAELFDLSGISKTKKVAAFGISIFIFSMIGIPPMAGFFGKFYIFKAVIASGNYFLAILGIMASVVSAYYYLRIIKVMYFDLPQSPASRVPVSLNIYFVITICAVFTIGFALFANNFLAFLSFAPEIMHD